MTSVDSCLKKRDRSIDLLRFIALTGIVIVHIYPSEFWTQLRSFDVPLMVFLSGISYRLSGGNTLAYKKYCVKRFKRLVLPVWFFLPVYFLIYMAATHLLPPWKTVLSYYTLMTGWYVWIIRIFFVMALVAPFLAKELDKSSKRFFLGVSVLFLLLFEWYVNTRYSRFPGRTIVLTHFPYILVFALGYKIVDFQRKVIRGMMIVCMFVYLCISLFYINDGCGYLQTQLFKYPPQVYYLSYAMGCCLFLWLVRVKVFSFLSGLSLRLVDLIAFIGSHTIWIYLWHIPLVSMVKGIDSAIIRFSVVYILATIIVGCQTWLVEKLLPLVKDTKRQKNLRMIFIG